MTAILPTAPLLSTPDTHILNEIEPLSVRSSSSSLSDEQFDIRYEIQKTLQDIKVHNWRRIALQFPDDMLPDSARVYQLLARGLKQRPNEAKQRRMPGGFDEADQALEEQGNELVKLTILADTSYGSCCVDEIAAEHVDADAVIHYGRACLSPTARLPVVHVFTKQNLDQDDVVACFKERFSERDSKVILVADMPYAHHIELLHGRLKREGYESVRATEIIHEPSAPIPNRVIHDFPIPDLPSMQDWDIFHISDPPTSLLLTLFSRVRRVYVYSAAGESSMRTSRTLEASTTALLRRRYALVTSLSTVPTWGILINTLSVKNYLNIVDHVKSSIADAGKKSYMFVVGKLNAAKVANFAEIGGWVVIGCWETSLVDSKDFYKPVITPFELELALKRDGDRLWTGKWRADFDGLQELARDGPATETGNLPSTNGSGEGDYPDDDNSEEESAPPDFDLRTGRYISQTRPMQMKPVNRLTSTRRGMSTALTRRATGEMVAVKGVASPAADFLRSERTWQGLGSDFDTASTDATSAVGGGLLEEGRTGVASGYTSTNESKKT